MNRRLTACATVLAVAGLSFAGVAAAQADTDTAFEVYNEGDSPDPYAVSDALVFYKAADLGWWVNGTDGVALSDVTDLAYTVSNSTTYAPSYQLIVSDPEATDAQGVVSYARLVFEPYMQSPVQGPNTGTFTDLEDGLWWGNSVFHGAGVPKTTVTGDGSQAAPQTLAFWEDYFGPNAVVTRVAIHQGSTTDATATVTEAAFGGDSIQLGTPDATPFAQADIDAATAPLIAEKADLAAQVGTLTDEKADLTAQVGTLTDEKADLTAQVGTLTDAKTALEAQVADLETYKSTHTTTDAAVAAKNDLNLALKASWTFQMSGTPKVGNTLTVSGVKYGGLTYHYEWFVGGKAVADSDKSTFVLPEFAAGKTVSVKTTRAYTNSQNVVKTVVQTTKAVTPVLVAK